MTLIFGFSSFASVETPVASPPPPMGTRIYQRKLLENLHGDGTLTGSYGQIIKRMNKGIAVLFCQFVCLCTCLIIDISVQYYLCTIASGTVYFD